MFLLLDYYFLVATECRDPAKGMFSLGFCECRNEKNRSGRSKRRSLKKNERKLKRHYERSDGTAAERARAVSGAGEASERKGGGHEAETDGGGAAEAEPDEAAGQEQVAAKTVVCSWNEVASGSSE